jgi:hypothetical protein
VTAETLANCPEVVAMLAPIVNERRFYRHQKMPMDQVTFYMIGDNATVVKHRLDEILVERKKFICLNDDMKVTSLINVMTRPNCVSMAN